MKYTRRVALKSLNPLSLQTLIIPHSVFFEQTTFQRLQLRLEFKQILTLQFLKYSRNKGY